MQMKQQNSYIKNSPKSKKNIWINIGMAGSNNYSLGEVSMMLKKLPTLINVTIPVLW